MTIPTPPLPDDDGSAAIELTTRLDGFAAGDVDGAEVLEALAQSRLLVPVVAILDESETGPDGMRHEKHSSMATVLVRSSGGGQALLAFSSIAALNQWRPAARPVPLVAPLAARAAIDEDADTLLIDVAGQAPFAVSGNELLLLAAVARPPGEACDDPVLLAALTRLIRAEDRIASATLLSAEEVAVDGGAKAGAALFVGVAAPSEGDRSWLGHLVQRIATDPVVRRLLPEGLRIKEVPAPDLSDTPDEELRRGRSL